MLKKYISTVFALTMLTSLSVMGGAAAKTMDDPTELALFSEKCEEIPGMSMESISFKLNPIQDDKVLFSYKVTKGDQIEHLAKMYHTTPLDIKSLNDLKGDTFDEDQIILIPFTFELSQDLQRKVNHSQSTQRNQDKNIDGKKSSDGGFATRKGTVTRLLNMKATAYGNDHGWGNKTAMGTQCRKGVIAIDASFMKKYGVRLGSKVFVSGYTSAFLPTGGFVATVEDTGVKGNKIDIYLPYSEKSKAVTGFGVQNVKVEILS